MMEQNKVGEIYVDDDLITSPTDMPEHKAEAYRVAYGMMVALARDYTAPRYVKVQTPNREHLDLLTNYQYRFIVRIGDTIATSYASGELVDGDYDELGDNLAIAVRRTFQLSTPIPPPAPAAP
jgi:hypothetical protein